MYETCLTPLQNWKPCFYLEPRNQSQSKSSITNTISNDQGCAFELYPYVVLPEDPVEVFARAKKATRDRRFAILLYFVSTATVVFLLSFLVYAVWHNTPVRTIDHVRYDDWGNITVIWFEPLDGLEPGSFKIGDYTNEYKKGDKIKVICSIVFKSD